MDAFVLEYDFVQVRAFAYILWESRQNDICSFSAMNVALTVSFKLISF